MADSELALPDYAKQMDEVVELYCRSYSLTEIARRTGLKRAKVQEYIDDFQTYIVKSGALTDRAAEVVVAADKHYGQVISQAHDIAERAQEDDEKKVEISALSLAASTQEKRVKMFKDSGIMENLELAKQNSEMETKVEEISDMLLDIARDHPELKDRIVRELTRIMDKTIPLSEKKAIVVTTDAE